MDKRLTTLGVLALLPLAAACGTRAAGDGSARTETAPVTGVHRTADGRAQEREAPLRGTKWTVTALGDNNVSRPLPKGANAYFVLGEDGTLDGLLGCNHASAQATVGDGHITLGRARTTRMMCQDSLMRIEKTLLGLFDGKVAYMLDHDGIALTSANGTVVSAVADE
ncbi:MULTISPECIES: META domain-containing protein [unclassified Streptomyces]|uniref:META domain-containing protein n=1 Tax=unclassified Streptomyces TaxID=2593676 RepID=UPI0033A2D8E2